MFAQRLGAETVEVASSHVAMVSHPEAVVEVIEAAATGHIPRTGRGGSDGLTARPPNLLSRKARTVTK